MLIWHTRLSQGFIYHKDKTLLRNEWAVLCAPCMWTNRFEGGSGPDEIQDHFVCIPLHSGGDIAVHLGMGLGQDDWMQLGHAINALCFETVHAQFITKAWTPLRHSTLLSVARQSTLDIAAYSIHLFYITLMCRISSSFTINLITRHKVLCNRSVGRLPVFDWSCIEFQRVLKGTFHRFSH